MGYQSRVNPAGEEREVMPLDTIVTMDVVRYDGPHASNQKRKDGSPAAPFMKVYFQVVGPEDWAGEELDCIASTWIGATGKTRELFQSALGRELQDEEVIDWDMLLNKRLQGITGIKVTEQGGRFTSLTKFMRQPQRQARQRPSQPARPPVDVENEEEVPF